MKNGLFWLGLVVVTGCFLFLVAQKQALRQQGQTLFLHLAPRDPRSPMQGDYMDLNYQIPRDIHEPVIPESGSMIVGLDEQQVAHFVRLANNQPLAPGEHLLKYRYKGGRMLLGAENYFIPEGSGDSFSTAAYGEMKVGPNGDCLLVGLRDKDLKPLVVKP